MNGTTPSEHHACDTRSIAEREVRTASLSLGGQLFVWSARRWRIAVEREEPLGDVFENTYRIARCPEAMHLVDELLSLVAVSAFRPFAIRCVPCQTLSSDEWLILRAMQEIQREDQDRALTCIGRIVVGPLRQAFCRSATPYIDTLVGAGLSLLPAKLHAVE